MSRIACLLVPDLPVAAACRADPELAGRPLALSEGSGPHARVVAASRAAGARGVQAGRHTVAQARAIAADLIVRPHDEAAERSAVRALVDVAASLASRIETAADGAVFLDTAGATHLVPSEAGLATALVARAARVGLAARAAVGGSMTVARLAALHATEVVPPGTELGFLAPLPLACLAPPPAIATTLERWGIRQLGDLARLPVAEVATRLGPAGAALVRAARGEDERPLAPQALGGPVEEAIGLEYALDTLEPLLFVLRGLAERAVARVGLEGIGVARLGLALGLADRSRDERVVPLAAPTRDVKTLLTCLRVELEARPPRAAVERVALAAVPEAVRAAQLGLFHPPGPSPERLATTLARLAALCGADRVGAPAVVDSHRPGAAALAPFTPGGAPTPPATNGCRLVVRALRPPRPVEVFADRDRPDFVRGEGLGGRVVGAAGPWRVTGEWWSDGAFARDYYDLELSDGGLYRCFRENGQWFVDGVYD
ncbi:MAG TPA: DNA polymerase Y family protein [Candidatus Limnocylindria bacterium]|nr:DNA polymerase Y family protein [Candidatus Limnocylindria bacterium]